MSKPHTIQSVIAPISGKARVDLIGNAACVEGDSLQVMKAMEDGVVDLTMTSPPYNLGIPYADGIDDAQPRAVYLDWMREVFGELHRILKDDGQVLVNIGGSLVDPGVPYEVLQVARDAGFQLQNNIIWAKHISVDDQLSIGHFKPVNSDRFLNNVFEHVFHLTKDRKRPIDRLSVGVKFVHPSNLSRWNHTRDKRCRGNIWMVPYETVTSQRDAAHPATYPEQLVKMGLSLMGAKKGQIILDPFVGTGTTSAVAAMKGIDSIGIEMSPTYAAAFRARIARTLTPGDAPIRRPRVVKTRKLDEAPVFSGF